MNCQGLSQPELNRQTTEKRGRGRGEGGAREGGEGGGGEGGEEGREREERGRANKAALTIT